MVMLKVGDVVARKSYGYDVLFRVSNIYDDMVDLVGMTVRIIADAPIYDLKIMSPEEINKAIKTQEDHTRIKVNRCYSNLSNRFNFRDRAYYNTQYNNQFKQAGRVDVYQKESIYKKPGVIMHLDGDAHLSNKKKYSNTNTSEQVIFNHNKNNVSKIKIHYFFITKREEFCEREHI